MADIITRLTELGIDDSTATQWAADVARDAIDEIERLRAEVARLNSLFAPVTASSFTEEELTQMRAAVAEMMDLSRDPGWCSSDKAEIVEDDND